MENRDYEIELKVEEEQEYIIDRVEDELHIDLEERSGEELGVGTAIAIYSAVVGTAGLALTAYSVVKEEDPSTEITVKHEGEGDIYFIDVDEAEKVGGNIIEKEGDVAVAKLSPSQAARAHAEPEED
ncbi:hypothetical protein [Haloplanus salinarum]|uniref:hypothetical protein n=1 Tax=Haloplanus salinarum TaxID=1912324 RepID=UPI00214BAE8D|nr:hypothetical protein [Haloplanus salinarum]